MTEEKFIGYFRLVEACGQPGCPVCRCVVNDSRSYLDALLYEQVTDPDTRRAIRLSGGFCNWHTWMLLEVEHAIFGASIIYEDLVKLALGWTERLGEPKSRLRRGGWLSGLLGRRRGPTIVERYRRRAVCTACATVAEAESRYLRTLVTFVDDGDVQAAYARSDGLCLPHLLAALEANGESPGARTLVDRTREKWTTLGQDISSFVNKHDYRNREPFTAAEAASYARAFEALAGAKNVFGNDLHTRRGILGLLGSSRVRCAAHRSVVSSRLPPWSGQARRG